MDVCQSVLASFFVRAASGQYELDRPAQLLRLLVIMARNKLVSEARHSYVLRRDPDSLRAEASLPTGLTATGASPSHQAACRDLLQEVQRRLSAEERQLVERRAQHQEWSTIAAALGGSAEALRKKLARALDRIAQQLGVDELTHE
jgi:RNA polymerase sigma-70 factor (ECF subfamily)